MNEQQLQATKHAVEQFPHRYVGLIPFSREITSDEPLTGTDHIPYGSTLFTTLASALKWEGLHFDLNTFNYQAACANRDDMLNGEYILTVEEAVMFMQHDTHGAHNDWFIRPSKDLKQFSGQVIEAAECAAWLQDAMQCASSGSYQLDKDEIVVVATPKPIQAEWRWFIVNGKIVDGSMYRARGQLVKKHETDADVIAEAQTFADKWLPDPCCVMDLALVDDKLKVIEFNCINSSGFYNHDVDKIFAALYNYHN